MEPKGDRVLLEFEIPSRGIIGLRSQYAYRYSWRSNYDSPVQRIPALKGGHSWPDQWLLDQYGARQSHSVSINNLQDRGRFFVAAGAEIYEGQVIGENSRPGDLVINVTKTKKLNNMRSSGADEKMKLVPPKRFTLEEALEYIQVDEYVEVTPESLRLRKILLKEHDRKRARNGALPVA